MKIRPNIPSRHDLPPAKRASGSLFARLNNWIHRYPTWVFSGLCLFCALVSAWLYLSPQSFWYGKLLVAHFVAVFVELALAILLIEEVIKPKLEDQEAKRLKREKKRSFLRNMIRYNIDILLLDYIREYEQLVGLLPDKDTTYQRRMGFVQQNRKYLWFFAKSAPYRASVTGSSSRTPKHDKQIEEFYESWEGILDESIENIKLVCPKPQYTPFHAWDQMIEWYVELKRINHEVLYLRQKLSAEQEHMKMYFTALKALTALSLDLAHFGIFEESNVLTDEEDAFARKLWHVWQQSSTRT